MENKTVTIVTPTYNRADRLPMLFDSLCKQSCKDFEWLCIDDGSSDDTEKVISQFIRQNSQNEISFPIKYIYKKNGGKHSALNIAFKETQSELLFIVDSDDVLTNDAVASIVSDWNNIDDKGNICGIGYLRGYSETQEIGDSYSAHYFISNFIEERFNRNINGDKAEVWVTDKLRDFQFPEIEGESVAWIWLAKKYNMLFVNKIIYITEYLEGGLSDSGRVLRFKCPTLMAYGSLMTMSKEFSIKIRIKETLLYIVYSFFGKKSICELLHCEYKLLVFFNLVPGYILYQYWKSKFICKT